MGEFLKPEEMKAKATIDVLAEMTAADLDDLYVIPAERTIEEEFNLDLNTDAEPSYWAGRFVSYPNMRTSFRADFRRAAMILVNRMAVNRDGYGSQSVAGASVTYGKRIPEEVKSLMWRWRQPPRLYRS